jgi:hypothetical protein
MIRLAENYMPAAEVPKPAQAEHPASTASDKEH